MNLYLSTISRLLFMSVISSGTPNNIRACGPYGFENYVDMTETPLRSITNSGTWMLILAPTYSTKIFIGRTVMTTYVIPFVHWYVTFPRFDCRYLHT